MDDLIADFIAETREMLDALGGEIVAWEAEPGDRARLDSIFRFVHTVKGNSGFFDLPRIKSLSHAAEDALADVRSGDREPDRRLVNAVLAVIDRLGQLVQALETGAAVPSEDDAQLIAALVETQAAVEPVEAQAAITGAARYAVRTIRLPVELLDRMMSGVSDLVLARNELARWLRQSPAGVDVDAAFERVSCTIAEMRESITRTRMQRVDTLFASLPRMVRDLSAELGKRVALEVDGGDVELDREMIESIRDPLTHIVRNAIDHGIESAAEREAAGKPAIGTLRICARQAGNQILIEIADDGRGIDGDRLAAKAVAAGLLGAGESDRLSPAQRTALIFEPGLSTAGEVTAISGRGVGMDVVRANIERIGGLVDIDSRRDEGLCLTLKVPLTLTIIPALSIGIAGQCYAIPRSAIDEIVRVRGAAVRIERIGGSRIVTIRGRRLPLVSLGDALGVPHAEEMSAQSLIVLKPGGGEPYALAVDRFFDHEELVVKPAAPAVMATGLYAGTTLAENGNPILLLDPLGLGLAAGLVFGKKALEPAAPVEMASAQAPALLFTTLAGARRAVPLAAVDRIEEVRPDAIRLSAGRLHVSVGETVLPLLGCGDVPPDRIIRLLRLSDGGREIAYGFADVVDIVPLGEELLPAAVPGEVRGVTMIAGEQVELLDLYWLFESEGLAVARERPVCALPTGDPWMDNILRPIVESAGYRVVASDGPEAEGAAVRIVNAECEEEAEVPQVAGRVVRIRSALEGSGREDDSIHRYDRAALLSALAGKARA